MFLDLDPLREALPSHLCWYLDEAEDLLDSRPQDDEDSETTPNDLLMQRFYRCILADRFLMLIPGAQKYYQTQPRDLTAKRQVLHAMAMCAAISWQKRLGSLAWLWDEYSREHLYRAANEVAEAMELWKEDAEGRELEGQPEWRKLPEALDNEGVWPYWGGFVIEVLGSDEDYCALTDHWIIPPYEGKLDDLTRVYPLELKNDAVPTVQVCIGVPPTRPDAIEVRRTPDGFLCGYATLTPLELLQRVWEVRQIQVEAAEEAADDEESISLADAFRLLETLRRAA